MRCLWKFQQCQEKFRLFCTEVYLSMSFILCLKQIENKQPVQTSFRCVLWRQQFDLAEAVVTFFLVSKDTQHEMHALSRIFSSQDSKRAKLGSNKSQSKGQETSSDFVVSFGSLEQKLELERRTVCLSGRFFSCVVGFFALAADPRVFALRRVGNLGLWIFTW